MSKLKTQTHPSIQTTISMCWDSVLEQIDMLKKSNEGDLFLSKLKTKLVKMTQTMHHSMRYEHTDSFRMLKLRNDIDKMANNDICHDNNLQQLQH